MFELSSDFAPPVVKRGRPNVYPFADMAVGQSFAVPPELHVRVRAAAIHAGKRYGMTFTTRKQPDGSVRCWRTA